MGVPFRIDSLICPHLLLVFPARQLPHSLVYCGVSIHQYNTCNVIQQFHDTTIEVVYNAAMHDTLRRALPDLLCQTNGAFEVSCGQIPFSEYPFRMCRTTHK